MPIPRLRLTRFNTHEDLNLLMWETTNASARDRPRLWAIIEQLNGFAEGNLKECGNSEELASAYGIGARQLRRWMRAYIEGGTCKCGPRTRLRR